MFTFTDHRHSVDEHVLYAGGIPVDHQSASYRLSSLGQNGNICEIARGQAATLTNSKVCAGKSSIFGWPFPWV